MLSMRLQRTGRHGLAQYRLVVQDSRRTPTSGRVVASLGHYDPHTKTHGFDLKTAERYLKDGAQPSERVVKLLLDNGLKLPNWVAKPRVKKAAPKRSAEKESTPPVQPVAADEDKPADDNKDSVAKDETVAAEPDDTTPEATPAEPAKPVEEAAKAVESTPEDKPAEADKDSVAKDETVAAEPDDTTPEATPPEPAKPAEEAAKAVESTPEDKPADAEPQADDNKASDAKPETAETEPDEPQPK